MNRLQLTPLRRIPTPKGDVLHGMKARDPGFAGFGEAYFSVADRGVIKGWKRHRVMTLNLICIQGAIRFVAYEGLDRPCVLDTVLSPDNSDTFRRLTVPPGVWLAFSGKTSGTNMLVNIASHAHDPAEADTLPTDAFVWPEDPG